MNPEEIRAEIDRRKKLAIEMKLSNKVWSLYNSNFQHIDDKLKKDPELILPEAFEERHRLPWPNDVRL
jgi:hypothetical protein